MSAMKKATVMWTVVECNPDERGADALFGARGLFSTEEEAIVYLTDIRNDDPETGDGWTTCPITVNPA